MNPRSLQPSIEQLFRDERGQMLAGLVAQLKDFSLAEDVLQDAMTQALTLWPESGLPKNPKSWLMRVAINRAIDILRRQTNWQNKQTEVTYLYEFQAQFNRNHDDHLIADERLKLIFTCCHPALDDASQVALTLNTVCGLTTTQVAAAFLLKTPTMAQRLVRAKRKIKLSGISYVVPEGQELNVRLNNVLKVIYLIYSAGYHADDPQQLINLEHTDEAFYLARTLNELIPKQAEVLGLLALMCFHQSRIKARNHHPDEFISLAQQNRKLWHSELIQQANDWFTQAIECRFMGPYQIQAAISGVHSQAQHWEQTDWLQIVGLYEKLMQYWPSDTVRINLAVALSYAGKADSAWTCLQQVNAKALDQYLPYHLAYARVAEAVNQPTAAVSHLSLAMALANNPKEQQFIKSQMNRLSA